MFKVTKSLRGQSVSRKLGVVQRARTVASALGRVDVVADVIHPKKKINNHNFYVFSKLKKRDFELLHTFARTF